MKTPSRPIRYRRLIALLMFISILAWIGFIWLFRTFWPTGYQPGDSLAQFWGWVVVGSAGFVLLQTAVFRLLNLPPAWRGTAAAALVAPALLLDLFSTMFIDVWHPTASAGDARVYPSLVLFGVGVLLFHGIWTSVPSTAE